MCSAGIAYTSAATSISSRLAPPTSPLGAASRSRMPTPARQCRPAGAAIAVACGTILDRALGCVASSTPERGCCAAVAEHASGGWTGRADFTVAARARDRRPFATEFASRSIGRCDKREEHDMPSPDSEPRRLERDPYMCDGRPRVSSRDAYSQRLPSSLRGKLSSQKE
jgi:hypothetical protein